jgi:hypothetical protein
VEDSRAYSGTKTDSDHRLVMAKFNINWNKKTPKYIKTKKFNFEKLKDRETRTKYAEKVEEKLTKTTDLNAQEQWDDIVNACKEASIEVLGYVEKTKKMKKLRNYHKNKRT